MKRIASILTLFAFLFAAVTASAGPIPKAPSISGESYFLMDARTGQVLAAQKPDQRMAPASLTKLMTAYVVYGALEDGAISLQDTVEISEAAWRMGGSQMFLEVGTTATVDELLDGLVIQSGNDAAVALAEHTAGSEAAFVEQMNHHADRLGLENTHFMNPEGLPHEDHYSTAHDLALIAQAIIREFPKHYQRYSQREFTYNNIRQYNRNDLLWSDPSVDGLKTGYTEEAGYCLVTSAKRDGMRLISAVLGAPSEDQRVSDSRSLLSWGFRFFETHQLYAAGDVLKTTRIWKGARDQVDLGTESDVLVTIPRGEYDNLKAEVSMPRRLEAPVQEARRVGTVNVTLDGEAVAEVPLVTLQSIARGSFFQRMTDTVLQWFE
ncbi:MAG: D-alanyl-D-alanine carboxypeptidase family protein [Halofilum sp. (in: g-proteobacteria)]|nr:D-alanyl-D-alanine carboxypeptidase family protein [Halofilum sp. (in: g-proteobacteria)]